jgi:hypothetical protein
MGPMTTQAIAGRIVVGLGFAASGARVVDEALMSPFLARQRT